MSKLKSSTLFMVKRAYYVELNKNLLLIIMPNSLNGNAGSRKCARFFCNNLKYFANNLVNGDSGKFM